MIAKQLLACQWSSEMIRDLMHEGHSLIIANTHNLLRNRYALVLAELEKLQEPSRPIIEAVEFSYLPHAPELAPFIDKGWRLVSVVGSEYSLDVPMPDSRFLAYFERPVEGDTPADE